MKKQFLSISLIAFLVILLSPGDSTGSAIRSGTSDTLHVWCNSELSSLTQTWANNFQQQNPGYVVRVDWLVEQELQYDMLKAYDIGFTTDYKLLSDANMVQWKMLLGREIMVPVINPANPYLEEIRSRGIPREGLSALISGKAVYSWDDLLGNGEKGSPIHVFGATDNTEMTITNLQDDQLGLGLVNLAEIVSDGSAAFDERVLLLPIDCNSNGKLEDTENIFADFNDFSRGIWIGKYPRFLYRSIYSVSGSLPVDEEQLLLVDWILKEGQHYLDPEGFSALLSFEKSKNIQQLQAGSPVLEAGNKGAVSPGKIILFLLAVTVVTVLFMIPTVFNRERTPEGPIRKTVSGIFDENSVEVPPGLFFDKTHTWTFLEQNGLVRAGIDDFLQHITGRITRVKLKKKDEKIRKGEPFASIIQDGKQLEVYSPVSGRIEEVNANLIRKPGLLNNSPYEEGWVYRLKPDNWISEISTFYLDKGYSDWLKSEFTRLRSFLGSFIKHHSSDGIPAIVMQEGGELKDAFLEGLGPVEWEEFQEGFMDVLR